MADEVKADTKQTMCVHKKHIQKGMSKARNSKSMHKNSIRLFHNYYMFNSKERFLYNRGRQPVPCAHCRNAALSNPYHWLSKLEQLEM